MSRAQLTSTVEQSSGGVVSPFLAGKNKIINGDFAISQRGSSFSNPSLFAYTLDRWRMVSNNSGGTVTISQQAFTPGSAPVAGYEGAYFFRNAASSPTGATYNVIQHLVEDVRTLAGQTATLSFWAKADASRSFTLGAYQNFGSGGSSEVTITSPGSPSVTTSWQRFSYSFAVPSISGKTIGTGSSFRIEFALPVNTTQTFDIWGVQLEAGSVATPFTTSSNTLQGELALCQRYYYRQNLANNTGVYMTYLGNATMSATLYFPTIMRVTPSATCNINSYTTSNSPTATQVYLNAYYVGNLSGTWSSGATTIGAGSPNFGYINLYGWTSPTTGLLYSLGGGTSCYADWSAEL